MNKDQDINRASQNLLKIHNISMATKFKIWKILVWPVGTYGCETWTLKKIYEARIKAFHINDYGRFFAYLGQRKEPVNGYSSRHVLQETFWSSLNDENFSISTTS